MISHYKAFLYVKHALPNQGDVGILGRAPLGGPFPFLFETLGMS